MSGRVCRTPQEAFEAGFNALCPHGFRRQPDCPDCRLTETEISQLAVLLKGCATRPTASQPDATAAA